MLSYRLLHTVENVLSFQECYHSRQIQLNKHLYLMEKLSREVAVASGAVLRALRRHESHSRIIQSSYGFLITEVYEPETIAAHLEIRKPRRDKLDNERYVKNTLTWLVNKVSGLPGSE